MRRKFGLHVWRPGCCLVATFLIAAAVRLPATVKQSEEFQLARLAYEKSDYAKAVQELLTAATRDPQNGEIQLLLTKSYIELQEHDAAINSAERAVAIDPKSSLYHEWLGKAYGEK